MMEGLTRLAVVMLVQILEAAVELPGKTALVVHQLVELEALELLLLDTQ